MIKNDEISIQVEFGKRIRYLREKKRISQEELAFRCNLNKNYISDIERGTRNPTLKVIEKLAEGLEIKLTELFFGLGGNN